MTSNPIVNLYPKVDAEKTFDELVREYPGGVVLKEKISASPDFLNADYIFHFEKIVAELKCVTTDNSNSPAIQAKVNHIVNKFFNEGKIPTTHIDENNWPKLPPELTSKIYQLTTNTIKNQIQKANSQIRETKEKLKLTDYGGLLILVNDGMTSLPPAAFVNAAMQILRFHFSEIQYFIFTTVNLFAELREAPMPSLCWIAFDMQRGVKMDEVFTNALFKNLRQLVSRKTGIPNVAAEIKDMEGFWKSENIT